MRWLLHPGATYEAARRRYAPFDRLVDPDPNVRGEIATAALDALESGREALIIVNNKAEGSAPLGIVALARHMASQRGALARIAGSLVCAELPSRSSTQPLLLSQWRTGRLSTETVYGLGANARDPAALRKIFEAKGRPPTHPLILHIDCRFLPRWVAGVPPEAGTRGDFWPGPLTIVLRRSEDVSDVLTGGQDTVAIRIPSHPMAQQLLTAFGGGIAAPSANRFGRVSPTRAEHVREELGDAVAIILDGGECTIGVESTIVSLVGPKPRLLRPGSITQAQLEAVIGPSTSARTRPRRACRDRRPQHYSPPTAVAIVATTLLESRIDDPAGEGRRVAVLAQRPPRKAQSGVTWINAGRRLDVYAARSVREPAFARQGGRRPDPGRGSAAEARMGGGAGSPRALLGQRALSAPRVPLRAARFFPILAV